MKLYRLAVLSLLLTGCLSGPNWEIHSDDKLNNPLLKHESVGVQVPTDGRYETYVYEGSGIKTAIVFEEEFRKHDIKAELLYCSDKDCAQIAADKMLGYLFTLEIMHWEERQTSWSARTDRLTIKVTVIDSATGAQLASAYLQGEGTRKTLGGEHVEDLLPGLVSKYVSSLY